MIFSQHDYRTRAELEHLGEQIRDRAVQITVEEESAQVVQSIHAEHQYDDITPDDPPISQDMIKSWARDAYAGIPEMFAAYDAPSPASYQGSIDDLWSVAYALHPDILGTVSSSQLSDPIPAHAWRPQTVVDAWIDDIDQSRLGPYWAGTASDDFKSKFLTPLSGTVVPQSELAVALALALGARQQVVLGAHNNITKIGTHTLKALDAVTSHGSNDGLVLLDAAVAAVAVLFAIPTDGWSVAAAWGLATAVKGAVVAGGKVPSTVVGGQTVNAVITTMVAAIGSLENAVDQQQQAIGGFLAKVGDQLPPAVLAPPAPASVVDAARDPGALGNTFFPAS